MRLSLIFELLLVFVLLAFAASLAATIENTTQLPTTTIIPTTTKVVEEKDPPQTEENIPQTPEERHCDCDTSACTCCRHFLLPLQVLNGKACVSLHYLRDNRLAVAMSFRDHVFSNTTVSGRTPKPVCISLPGGITKFCGRIYNFGRQDENFKACLSLELRTLNEVEAAMRISCFRFGPDGLRLEPAEPLPSVTENEEDEDESDEDYDAESGFGILGRGLLNSLFA